MTVKYSQARLRDLGIEGGCDFPARLACAAINFEGSVFQCTKCAFDFERSLSTVSKDALADSLPCKWVKV